MAEIRYWEQRFVREFIVPEKQDRYLSKLKGPKHRAEILERLNHSLDFRPETATIISPDQRTATGLFKLLQSHGAAVTCDIMVDSSPWDGHNLRLERAIECLLEHPFGFVMICPPLPIAVYKREDIGEMFLLRPAGCIF